MVPEPLGRVVTCFLEQHFPRFEQQRSKTPRRRRNPIHLVRSAHGSPVRIRSVSARYVDYGFTADMEAKLDSVAAGRDRWRGVLEDFWGPFAGAVKEALEARARAAAALSRRSLSP